MIRPAYTDVQREWREAVALVASLTEDPNRDPDIPDETIRRAIDREHALAAQLEAQREKRCAEQMELAAEIAADAPERWFAGGAL